MENEQYTVEGTIEQMGAFASNAHRRAGCRTASIVMLCLAIAVIVLALVLEFAV